MIVTFWSFCCHWQTISFFITALKKQLKKSKNKKSKKKSKKKSRNKEIENRALKFEKHTKSMKIFFEIFLLELWRKHFWESWNSSASSDSSFAEIFFKIIFSPEAEIAKLFESTKHKCLHILFSDGMYFLKTKFVQESISFEKMKFKNKFFFELKVYNSPGFCSMLCLTILD